MTWLARATVLALGAATLTVPLGIWTGAEAAKLQPRTTGQTSTLAIIKIIGIGDEPKAIAVNDQDDTIYVIRPTPQYVSVINGRNPDDSSFIGGFNRPWDVAVNQADDTVYVINNVSTIVSPGFLSVIRGSDDSVVRTVTVEDGSIGVAVNQADDTVYATNHDADTVSVVRGVDDSVVKTVTVGDEPIGVAVNDQDDTVYVANNTADTLTVIRGSDDTVIRTIIVGDSPRGVAVNDQDDTVYVANSIDNSVSVINGRDTDDSSTIAVGNNPVSVAVDQADDTIYVTNMSGDSVSVIDGKTGTVTSTITFPAYSDPIAVAVDNVGTNAGLVYVANETAQQVSAIGRVSPMLSRLSGSPGASVTLSVDAPQVPYDVDDSTIASVTFGTTVLTGSDLTPQTGDEWDFTVPAGTGTVPVTVTFNGGLTASAGTFTYSGSPTPTPPTPASAPRNVTATPGDASATITWTAPASSGDYPITSYQATSTPAGRTCLVAAPALTCEITELTNRTRYTFTVQALTGAGWGETSSPSNTVTPEPATTPTILITGNRGSGVNSGRVYANGTTTGLTGEIVRARVKVTGETDYRDGSTRTVSANETFRWQRKTNKKTHVYFTHDQTRSNSITIPAR